MTEVVIDKYGTLLDLSLLLENHVFDSGFGRFESGRSRLVFLSLKTRVRPVSRCTGWEAGAVT